MSDLKQSWNKVEVEGVLVSKDISRRTYTATDGRQREAISGSITIRVEQTINGEKVVCDIPVSVFANKFTREGKENPSYTSIDKVLTEYVSLSAVDDPTRATKVRLNQATIQMNEFYSRDGKLISYPRIRASFIQSVTDNNFTPKASFDMEIVVLNSKDEVNANGETTGRYFLQGATIQYGNALDVVPFYVTNEKAINYMKSYWNEGATVRVAGTLNFTSVVEKKVTEKMDSLQISDAISEIFNLLRASNKYIDDTTPWILAKDESLKDRLETVLYHLLEAIRVSAVFLEAFLPDTSESMLKQINTSCKDFVYSSSNHYELGKPTPLFMRIEVPKE